MSFTMIYYYIPEDNDSCDELNAFGINKSVDQIKLKDIREEFPLPGKYHFRFKHTINKVNVWMDLVNDDCLALLYQKKIIVKATRIEWKDQRRYSTDYSRPEHSTHSANLFEFGSHTTSKETKPQNFDLLFNN